MLALSSRGSSQLSGVNSTFYDIDFYGFDLYSLPFQPLDRFLDFIPKSIQLKANHANFIRHTGLANIGDNSEFLPKLPYHRRGNEARRIHQPKPRLLFR